MKKILLCLFFVSLFVFANAIDAKLIGGLIIGNSDASIPKSVDKTDNRLSYAVGISFPIKSEELEICILNRKYCLFPKDMNIV